jgi:hypothetical protein
MNEASKAICYWSDLVTEFFGIVSGDCIISSTLLASTAVANSVGHEP